MASKEKPLGGSGFSLTPGSPAPASTRRPPVLRRDDVSENEAIRGRVVRAGAEVMAAVWGDE